MGRKGRYRSYYHQESGLRFDFYCEPTELTRLHISVRHGTTPEEAIGTFLEGETFWNEEHKRAETFTESHGLYWAWKVQDVVVVVISCFPREEHDE